MQSDGCLLALARDGHEAAFETLVRRYRRPLLRYCARIVPNACAEDVVQQAFMRAWRAIRDGVEIQDMRPWLYGVARNASLDWLRHAHDDAQLPENLAATLTTADRVQQHAAARDALTSVAALPERQRRALLGVAVEGRTGAEVAATLGLSENAFRQLLQRARTTVRAAATALTPVQLLIWLMGHRRASARARLIRVTAHLGAFRGGGVPAMLGKAPAALVAAGALAAAPVIVVTALHGAPRHRPGAPPHVRPAPARTLASLHARVLARPATARREAPRISSAARRRRHVAATSRIVPASRPAARRRRHAAATSRIVAASRPAAVRAPAAKPSVSNAPTPQPASGGSQSGSSADTNAPHTDQIRVVAAPPQAQQPSALPAPTDASTTGASSSSGDGTSTSSSDAATGAAATDASSSAAGDGSSSTATSSTDS